LGLEVFGSQRDSAFSALVEDGCFGVLDESREIINGSCLASLSTAGLAVSNTSTQEGQNRIQTRHLQHFLSIQGNEGEENQNTVQFRGTGKAKAKHLKEMHGGDGRL